MTDKSQNAKLKKKTGHLTPEEKAYIEENCETIPITKIGEHLNRHPEPIEKYIRINSLTTYGMTAEDIRRKDLIGVLHTKSYWNNIKIQFTEEELRSFELIWADLMLSFNEDIMFAEELQLNQLVTLQILMMRVMRDSQQHEQDMEDYQKDINEILSSGNADDLSALDAANLSNLEQQLSMARSAAGAFITTHTKLLGEAKFLHKDLKTTRDQRLKIVEDSKKTFADLIKLLDDESTRVNFGQEMELRRIAKDKSYFDLAQYHEYMDGMVDRPILNSETVMQDDEDGKID